MKRQRQFKFGVMPSSADAQARPKLILELILELILGAGLFLGVLLPASGAAGADSYHGDQYHGDQVLTLGLAQAVMSPTPLGPSTTFTPGPLQTNTTALPIPPDGVASTAALGGGPAPQDAPAQTAQAPASPPQQTAPEQAPPQTASTAEPSAPRQMASRNSASHPQRQKLATRARRNPLDAQAQMLRPRHGGSSVQVWPCRSGPLCGWKK